MKITQVEITGVIKQSVPLLLRTFEHAFEDFVLISLKIRENDLNSMSA